LSAFQTIIDLQFFSGPVSIRQIFELLKEKGVYIREEEIWAWFSEDSLKKACFSPKEKVLFSYNRKVRR
jgi:hypothetical protein